MQKKLFVKRISVLSLLLVLFSVIFGVEAAQAQDSPLTVNDCLKLLDRTLGEDDYASILKSKGFEKMEIPDEGEYDHHYFFLSKGEGIILEIYGAYDDTGSTDYVDISFAMPISAYFFVPDESDRNWKRYVKSEEDNLKFTHKSGVVMKRLGRLVEFKSER